MTENIWAKWLEDNYKYMVMGFAETERDRKQIMVLANICEKHGVSFKTYMDILSEFNKEIA